MDLFSRYPDDTFVKEPNDRRPLFTNGVTNKLVPKLPEPISTEELDALHALKSDPDASLYIDEWLDNSMFDDSPNTNKSNAPADNIDIDNFIREYRGLSKTSSNPTENLDNTSGQNSSIAHPNNLNLPAARNSNGLTTSSNHMATRFEDSGSFPTPAGQNISQPHRNTANTDNSRGYSQPSRHTARPDKKEKQIAISKVLHYPATGRKYRVSRTPIKDTHRHKLGRSYPVSRKWATEARAAPSVSDQEALLKPPNSSAESVSSVESATTPTDSSKSHGTNASSDSSPPATPKGLPPAPNNAPAPGSGGPGPGKRSVESGRKANRNISATSITVKSKSNRGGQGWLLKSHPIDASGPPLGNGWNVQNSSNPIGAGWGNVSSSYTNENCFGFVASSSSISKIDIPAGGFDVFNNAAWQNDAPPPGMYGMNGAQVHNSQPMPHGPTANNDSMYGSTTHNGAAIPNSSIPTYVPPYNLPAHIDPLLHYAQPIQGGLLPPNGAAIQNGAVPQNSSPTHDSRSSEASIRSYITPMQNGSIPSTDFFVQDGTMQFNATQMQGYPVFNDYNSAIQNGTVPLDGYPMQNESMPQYMLSMEDGYVPQYGPPAQNGSMRQHGSPVKNLPVPSYDPSMHNAPIPQYDPPRHYSDGSFLPPMHNDTMPTNNAPMYYAPAPAYGPHTGDGMMPAYGPSMQNPLMHMNNEYSADAAHGYISIPGGYVPSEYFPNWNALNGNDANKYVPNGPNGYAHDGQVANGPRQQT